jgi:hypothetical protein
MSLPISQAAPRAKPDMVEGQAIRLNLGGRNRPISGFKLVDLYEGPEVDIRSDCSDLSMFEDGSVSEIYASHILEHWSHTKTVDVLKEWRRVLKQKGKAFISVPDFEAAIRVYNKVGFCEYVRNLLYGDQNYSLAFHYTCFTFPILAACLVKGGFEDVKRIHRMPYGIADCSTNYDTVLKHPISINVEAIA